MWNGQIWQTMVKLEKYFCTVISCKQLECVSDIFVCKCMKMCVSADKNLVCFWFLVIILKMTIKFGEKMIKKCLLTLTDCKYFEYFRTVNSCLYLILL